MKRLERILKKIEYMAIQALWLSHLIQRFCVIINLVLHRQNIQYFMVEVKYINITFYYIKELVKIVKSSLNFIHKKFKL